MSVLSDDQIAVMALTINGLSVLEISQNLGVPKRTVESRRNRAIKILGASNIVHAAVIFDRIQRNAP